MVAREIEVGLLGNTEVKSTLPGEVVKDVEFYDYKAKYIDNKITMAIPAEIDQDTMTKMRTYAESAFKALGYCGLSRCDFFLKSRWTDLPQRTKHYARLYSMVYVSPFMGKYGIGLF